MSSAKKQNEDSISITSSIKSESRSITEMQNLTKEESEKKKIFRSFSKTKTLVSELSDDNDDTNANSVQGSLNHIYALNNTPCNCICKCNKKKQKRQKGKDNCQNCHYPFVIVACKCEREKNLKALKKFCEKRKAIVEKFKKIKLLQMYDKRSMGKPCQVAKYIVSKYPEFAHLIPVKNRGFGKYNFLIIHAYIKLG